MAELVTPQGTVEKLNVTVGALMYVLTHNVIANIYKK